MAFVQIMEVRSSRFEEFRKVEEEWLAATEGKRTARRQVLCRDRSDPQRYFNVVFFDSYESAMQNSNLPDTQRLAEKMRSATEGAPVFYDLDVIEDRSL